MLCNFDRSPEQRIARRCSCRLKRMANVSIDDQLLCEAQRVGGHRTKTDAANEALREYVQRRRQAKVVELFGQIDFDETHDHTQQRRRR